MTIQTGLEARARDGDGQAFGQLLRQWDDDLRGVVWSVVRSSVDTDDVMQAAYEKAFRSLGSFRRESSMKTWLHSICFRTALDHVRYEKRRRHESDEVLANQPSRTSTSRAALGKTELASALERLDPETRALLMLTTGLGYSFDEVAEIAGIPRGTVASRVSRAKQAVRDARQSSSTSSSKSSQKPASEETPQ